MAELVGVATDLRTAELPMVQEPAEAAKEKWRELALNYHLTLAKLGDPIRFDKNRDRQEWINEFLAMQKLLMDYGHGVIVQDVRQFGNSYFEEGLNRNDKKLIYQHEEDHQRAADDFKIKTSIAVANFRRNDGNRYKSVPFLLFDPDSFSEIISEIDDPVAVMGRILISPGEGYERLNPKQKSLVDAFFDRSKIMNFVDRIRVDFLLNKIGEQQNPIEFTVARFLLGRSAMDYEELSDFLRVKIDKLQ